MLETGHERNKMTELYEKSTDTLSPYVLITNNNQAIWDAIHNAFIYYKKEKCLYLDSGDFVVKRYYSETNALIC